MFFIIEEVERLVVNDLLTDEFNAVGARTLLNRNLTFLIILFYSSDIINHFLILLISHYKPFPL